VTNYVDLTLKSPADEPKVRQAMEPVCRDLNERIEPVRDTPAPVRSFTPAPGMCTLRYRVRVLP